MAVTSHANVLGIPFPLSTLSCGLKLYVSFEQTTGVLDIPTGSGLTVITTSNVDPSQFPIGDVGVTV
jgi:hypothetical protein